MGVNGNKLVWVGVSQKIMGAVDIRVASTLKGLCDDCGVFYGQAIRKKIDGGFYVISEAGVTWYFVDRAVRKVSGRGNFR